MVRINKIFLLLILIFTVSCKSLIPNEQKFKGKASYQTTIDSSSETFINQLEYESRYNVYEPKNKKYLVYLGPKIQNDYNYFKKQTKINVYTTLGLEF